MSSFPKYTAHENLLRVLMDKHASYMVVEGEDDLPAYETIVHDFSLKHGMSNRPIIVFGGGKTPIYSWLDRYSPENASVLLDNDFRNSEVFPPLENVFFLDRYCLENYFFDEKVIAPFLASSIGLSAQDVENNLELDELFDHWEDSLDDIAKVLYFYQENFDGEREGWNQQHLLQDGAGWKLCMDRITAWLNRLLDSCSLSLEACLESCVVDINLVKQFPGKLLVEPFHRYLRNLIREHGGTAVFNSKQLRLALIGYLSRNASLEEVVLPALNYS